MMKKLLLLLPLLAGCTTPSVIHVSGPIYTITRSTAAGLFADITKLKSETIVQANAFAAQQGKSAVPVSMNLNGMSQGAIPTFEYVFKLVETNSSEALAGLAMTNTVQQKSGL